jgi:hypothetical protein
MIITRPHTYLVTGRTPGSGPVVALLTDGPTDMAVAAHAAGITARYGTLLIAAAAVHTNGFRVNAPRRTARDRIDADTHAVVARVTPILHSAGVAFLRSALPVPAGTDLLRALPVTAVHRLAHRFGAVTVVAADALHDPTGVLQAAEPFLFTGTRPAPEPATPVRYAPMP